MEIRHEGFQKLVVIQTGYIPQPSHFTSGRKPVTAAEAKRLRVGKVSK